MRLFETRFRDFKRDFGDYHDVTEFLAQFPNTGSRNRGRQAGIPENVHSR